MHAILQSKANWKDTGRGYANYSELMVSLVPRPSRSHANIIREIFYMHQKAGRSGNEATYGINSRTAV